MSENTNGVPTDNDYTANLWEYPDLTVAIFGMQIASQEAGAMYFEAGLDKQIRATLAQEPGLLCLREFAEGHGGVLLQYWRSHQELSDFSKRMPHMAWWKWLLEHDGQGFSFYHEIYQCKTAEAVFQKGTTAVGPGTFCSTTVTEMGSGRSVERQRRFTEAGRA